MPGCLSFLDSMIIYYYWMWSLGRLLQTLSVIPRWLLIFVFCSPYCSGYLYDAYIITFVCVLFTESGGYWSHVKFVLGAGIWVSITISSVFLHWSLQFISLFYFVKFVYAPQYYFLIWLLYSAWQIYDWKAAFEVGYYQIYSCKSHRNSISNIILFVLLCVALLVFMEIDKTLF